MPGVIDRVINKDRVLNMRVSPVFVKNMQAKKRIVINQGGTRSGKTYSILQRLLVYAMFNKGKIIDVVRKTKAEIRATVLTDFIEILTTYGLYTARIHNKTHDEFYINGNTFRFIGLDKAQKKRGSKRNILYVNECNGITLEDWIQLSIRASEQIFLDFNPSEEFWLHDHVIGHRDDYDFIKSTYLDNYDFLPLEQIKEIERLIDVDEFYYKVYVLGELAQIKGTIYSNYRLIDPEEYDAIDYDEIFYGLDFGFEHKTVLMEIKYAREEVFERVLYSHSHKFDEDLIKFMEETGISMSADIYADPAYPASIRKIRNAGYTVRKAKKDVKDGITFCRSLKRNICKSSGGYIKNIKKYKNKQTPDGKILDCDPVKFDDDELDAMRYGEYSHLKARAGDN